MLPECQALSSFQEALLDPCLIAVEGPASSTGIFDFKMVLDRVLG